MIHSSSRTPAGRRQSATAADHAALEVRHRALLLGPLGHRQDDVREGGRLGEEEVGDHEQVERSSPARTTEALGAETTTFEPCTSSARAAVRAECLQELDGRDAGTRDHGRVDAPHRRRRGRARPDR